MESIDQAHHNVVSGYVLPVRLAWLLDEAKVAQMQAEKKREVFKGLCAGWRIEVINCISPFVRRRQVVSVERMMTLETLIERIGDCTYEYMRLKMTLELISIVLQLRGGH